MSIKLLLDPATRRILYAAYDGVLPRRVMVLDDGRQHLFQLAHCEVVDFDGTLPAGMHFGNSYAFVCTPHGVVRAGGALVPLEKAA